MKSVCSGPVTWCCESGAWVVGFLDETPQRRKRLATATWPARPKTLSCPSHQFAVTGAKILARGFEDFLRCF